MSESFPKLRPLGGNVKVELDLSNFATKATGIDASKLANWIDLASFKAEVDELETGKFQTIPIDASKLSDIVKNELAKDNVFDELVKNINAIQIIDTSTLVRKTEHNTKINGIEKKITGHDYSNKYINTQELNKLTSENFAGRLKQANLATKDDTAESIKKNRFWW